MTTSPDFTYNRDQVIRRALRLVGAIQSGETPGAQENQDAVDALNALVSELQATGLHLWKESEGTFFLQPNQIKYGLGGNTTDQSSLSDGIAESFTSLAIIAGSSAIPVVSTAGIANGSNFGVMMSNNVLFWSTVSSVVGSMVNLAAPVTTSVNANAPTFCYATRIIRPLRIVDARRYYISSKLITPLVLMSRLDYRDLPNKANTGVITQLFYDPQLSTGYAWVWPAPIDSTSAVKFTWMEPIFNFNTAADQPDFPVEWFNCLVWNLAKEIMLEYDVPVQRAQMIQVRSKETFDLVSGFDREPESYFFGVNFDQSTR
jgi:hypothetical protein